MYKPFEDKLEFIVLKSVFSFSISVFNLSVKEVIVLFMLAIFELIPALPEITVSKGC